MARPSHHPLPALLLGASLALVAPSAGVLAADAGLTPVVAPKWDPWLELGGFWGSDELSRGEAVLWAPLLQGPDTVLFTDLRGKLFEDDVQEGNFALGWRRMTPSGWNFGAWAGVDVRDTEADNTFWQLSGGLEALSADWDLRVNGYVPLSDPEASPSLAEVRLEGNNIFMVGGEEVPLSGVDGEVGYRVFATPDTGFGPHHELRLYGGGFWFDADEALEEVAGPKARVEYRIDEVFAGSPGSRLTVEAEYSNDDVRDDRWEVGLRVRIPLWAPRGATRLASLSGQERRMAEGLERDTDIVTAQSAAEPVADAATEVAFDRVAYVEGGGSVTNTSTQAGDNTLIIANGTVNGAQQLQGKQTLQGGGSTIEVRGQNSGTVASFTAPGSRPTLADPANAPNLALLGSATHVAGLDIVGSGAGGSNDGIFGGSGLSNLLIEQTSIADTGSTGILFLDNNSDVTIADTTVAGSSGNGIVFGDDNSDVTIAGTSIANTSFHGIAFSNGNTDVTITDTTIANTGNIGILFNDNNSDVTIADTSITDAGGAGIFFVDDNSNVTITGTSIANTSFGGILFVDDNSNVTITGTSIANTGNTGILFNDNNSDVSITGTSIANTDFGIAFADDNSGVTIADTTIGNASVDGILFITGNTVTLENSTLAGTFGDDGIDINGSSNTLAGAGNTAAGATFGTIFAGGQFCEVTGVQTGFFTFVDDGTGNPATCPP